MTNLSELYSADSNKIKYIQQQIHTIYTINAVLFSLYYALVFIFIYYAFTTTLHYSNRTKMILFTLLIIFPFTIYRLEEGAYSIGKYLVGKLSTSNNIIMQYII